MPIINNLLHEPKIERIEKEEQLIDFLKEIKSSIGRYLNIVNLTSPKESLKDILKIVEEGKYEGRRNTTVTLEQDPIYRIDLSKAKQIIYNYRRNSEGGCQSCKKIASYMPCQDEHVTYCTLFEVADVVSSGSSPRISAFYQAGCNDRKPVFKRKLEEILEGQK
jgi:hypothetical protein